MPETSLLFEMRGVSPADGLLPAPKSGGEAIPPKYKRVRPIGLPELSEQQVVRHFTRLSQRNFCVDTNFYPLGSCTMKHNPRINESLANLPGFADLHPYQPHSTVQGMLQLLYELQEALASIAGMDAVSLQPAAGAHGELTGLMVISAYFRARGERRTKILIPDSAHGTNPASSMLCGCTTLQIPSDRSGGVDLLELEKRMSDDVAALMITNPNTLGLFERDILRIAEIVHARGGLLYMDGANMNALLGIARPGDFGVDVMHYNCHKTFSTPHGGGGPGAGPIAVKAFLAPFLPVPIVARRQRDDAREWEYFLDYDRPQSIGCVRCFFGNVGVLVKTYAYIRHLGPHGLRRVAERAVLNANYLRAKLRKVFDLPYDRPCMHEFVLSAARQAARGVKAMDIAKRLIDFGIHPPTICFPLIVPEALMIEPTETESKEMLDFFVEVMTRIAEEARSSPEIFREAPHPPCPRVDEVKAARELRLRWSPKCDETE